MNKKLVLPLVVIILAIAVGVGLALWQNHPGAVKKTSDQPAEFDPRNPNWKVGSIISVSPTIIEFSDGPNKLVAQISPTTQLVKQVKNAKTGLVEVAPAALSDFKPKTMIVVSFSAAPNNNVYQADKIQIIGQ